MAKNNNSWLKDKIPVLGRVYRQRDDARDKCEALKSALLECDNVKNLATSLSKEHEKLHCAKNRFTISENMEMFADTDEDKGFDEIWEKCQRYTMTSFSRGLALYRAIRHIVKASVQGDIVECGVWRGGSTMIALHTLIRLGVTSRKIFLYDTYEGMSTPCAYDADNRGVTASDLLEKEADNRDSALVWAYAGLDEVMENIRSTGYPMENIEFIKGDVLETLPHSSTRSIALLRLDTDFYESTKVELETLYPRLLQNGVLIIDDFGHWQGARRAVEEYFSPRESGAPVLFHRIDYTGRMLVRADKSPLEAESRLDYIPPGLADAGLTKAFPSLSVRDPFTVFWPYLRSEAPHYFRTDLRNIHDQTIGVLSIEEATILYNSALLVNGRRALEIGCHLGWSAAHLLAGGLVLDIVDPQLHYEDQAENVRQSLDKVTTTGHYKLLAAFSPSIVPALHKANGEDWALVFIDGNHDGDAPKLDSEAVIGCCAENAIVLFHDLKSPFVAQGLAVFQNNGWNTGLYNTMQIMGVAWRGDVTPIVHIADPRMPQATDSHLQRFRMLSV